jgi:hypothetical protein
MGSGLLIKAETHKQYCIELQSFCVAKERARHQWLTPVILASWEAEIGKIDVSD